MLFLGSVHTMSVDQHSFMAEKCNLQPAVQSYYTTVPVPSLESVKVLLTLPQNDDLSSACC